MRSAHRLLCAFAVVAALIAGASPLSAATAPILFEKNEGQFPRELDYVARAEGQAFLLEGHRATVTIGPAETPSTLQMTFVGANPDAAPASGERATSHVNYIRGNDRSRWVANVPSYHSVRYDGLYPGIDVEYHARQGVLEYDLIVAPGADWRHIALAFEGAKPSLDATGALVFHLGGKEVRQHAPILYQDIDGERKPVAGKYVVDGERVSFEVGAFDATKTLVIDPTFDFNRVIQPLLNTRPTRLYRDAAGHIYVIGTVLGPNAKSLFPTSKTGYSTDVLITRLTADGAAVEFTTVFGGERDDTPAGLAFDSIGNIYATGNTRSADFPTTAGAFCEYVKDFIDGQLFLGHAWVAKLDGVSGNVIWSTYLERPLLQDGATSAAGIAVDSNGFPIVAGDTDDTQFPVTQPSPTFGAFLTKFAKDGKSLVFSKKVAGSFFRLAASADALYLHARNMTTTPGVYAPAKFSLSDEQIAKFDMAGNQIWVTYWPSQILDMTLDANQNVITITTTTVPNLPVTGISWGKNVRGTNDMYIAKLSSSGTTLLASTYFGGAGLESAYGVSAAGDGSIVVTGQGNSLDLPMVNPIQNEHWNLINTVSTDMIIAKLDLNLATLTFCTYLGPHQYLIPPLVDPNGKILFGGGGAGTGTWIKGPQPPHAAIEGDAFVARIDLNGIATLRIDSIVPAAVVNASGGTVDIRGHGFVPGAKIYFGTTEMSGPTVAVTAGGTRLASHVPDAVNPGKVDIIIKNPNGATVTKPQGFEHLPAFEVLSSATPATVSTLGGPVTITGSNFPANPGIAIEPHPISIGRDITNATSTSISFIMPPMIRPPVLKPTTPKPRIRLLFPRGDLFTLKLLDMGLELSPLPVINDVRPAAGSTSGGGHVTVTGSNFANGARVVINNVYSKSVTFIDQFTLLAEIPPNTGGLSDVKVINPDFGTVVKTAAYTYRGITSITPASGPATGGQTVTINGFGFATSGNVVKFGGTAATTVTYVSDTQLTAVTPPHVAGFFDVEVTSNGETSTLAGAYRYLDPPPAVTSVNPVAGPKTGGSVVTVNGTGFANGAEVFFGNAKATNVTFVNASQLTATTAPSPAGTFDVVVRNPDQQSAALTNGFTYRGINTVDPTKGSPGTVVTINGGGFENGATVMFGALAATNVTVVNSTQITATAPNGTPGEVDLVVNNPGGTVLTLTNGFRFLPPPPTVTSFNPVSGFPGDSVTITGTNYIFVTKVTFNNVEAVFTVDSATQITATVPNTASTGAIKVTTESGTGTSATNFTVLQAAAEIDSFTPEYGGEGTTVVITGDKLAGATSVKFGGIAAQQFTANSRTQLTAITAANGLSGPICITTPGGFTGCSATDFLVPPRINNFAPGTGAPGTSVTLTGVNFTGATAVTFNGIAATFTVDSGTQITATVPANASTGPIAVTTPAGSGETVAEFGVPPVVTSFTPAAGPFGASVTISGLRFLGTTQVTFNGTNATYTVVNATTITATVPNGATDGPIAVTTPAGTATSASNFNVTFPPTISSFTPTAGDAGTLVSITGTDFNGATQVLFNGVPAAFTIVNATNITATVPASATNGPISITNSEGTGTSSGIFSLPPVLSSFAPNAGAIGSTVTLSGTNFVGATFVKFNGTVAAYEVSSNDKIIATVPAASTSGVISVTTGYGTVSSAFSFTVLSSSTPTVVATATGATSVSVTWSGDPTHTYDVRRINNKNQNFTSSKIATVVGNAYADTTVLAGQTYLYNIRDVSNGLIGNSDYATTIVFTDDPLNPGTIVKASHFAQLRSAVNALRVAAALPAATFTDPALPGLPYRHVHVNELRTALNEALLALGRFANFTDSTIEAGMLVRAAHVREIRDAVK